MTTRVQRRLASYRKSVNVWFDSADSWLEAQERPITAEELRSLVESARRLALKMWPPLAAVACAAGDADEDSAEFAAALAVEDRTAAAFWHLLDAVAGTLGVDSFSFNKQVDDLNEFHDAMSGPDDDDDAQAAVAELLSQLGAPYEVVEAGGFLMLERKPNSDGRADD